MIEFGQMQNIVGVKIDGKIVGNIRFVRIGWQFFLKGQEKGGEIFGTLQECKDSLK